MKKITPSEMKRQALKELLRGKVVIKDADSLRSLQEEGCLSEFIKLLESESIGSVEKTLQELLEKEQEETLRRARYERGGDSSVYRNGYEPGRLKTGEGVMEIHPAKGGRGLAGPYRSDIWSRLSSTSEQLRQLIMEMYTLGMSTLDVEQALQNALGGFVLSKSSARL